MSNTPQIPRLIAILIGIDTYKNYPSLPNCHGADDAEELGRFLTSDFKAKPGDVTLLQGDKASRVEIMKVLDSLKDTPERNNAIVVFFSGYTGRGRPDKDKPVGMICPVDIGGGTTGIPDKSLIQLFDSISKTRGNNITVFLDCGSDIFTWDIPSSFVVVAPRRAAQTEKGGLFTSSLIKVLRSEKESIQLLTVQSLADKIQADIDREIRCYGQNVDRLLFNPSNGRAYHAFISGKIEKGGDIILAAGSAHGVQRDTVFGIYSSNVINKSQNKILGHLSVSSVNNATSATLSSLEGVPAWSPPTVFYASEIRYPDEKVNILFTGTLPHNFDTSSSWEETKVPKDANITLNISASTVGFSWNGVSGDRECMRDTQPVDLFSLSINDKHIKRTLRSAARFMYHLSRSSPEDSSLAVEVELQRVDANNGKPDGKNILTDGFAELAVSENKSMGPFCLKLHNSSGFNVWPFIFICDPRGFNILPWHTPHPTATEAPLKSDGPDLIVGCGAEDGLLFQRRQDRKVEISYIKIFLTTKRTSFASLIQCFRSDNEDKLREAEDPQGNAATVHLENAYGDSSGNLQSPSSDAHIHEVGEGIQGMKLGKLVKPEWAAIRITIKQTYN